MDALSIDQGGFDAWIVGTGQFFRFPLIFIFWSSLKFLHRFCAKLFFSQPTHAYVFEDIKM